jgi:hypothetical protein
VNKLDTFEDEDLVGLPESKPQSVATDKASPITQTNVQTATAIPVTTQPAVATAVATQVAQQAATSVKTADVADADDMDTNFDDESVYSTPKQFNQCRPGKKGEAARFAFVDFVGMKKGKKHFCEVGVGKEAKRMTVRCLVPVGVHEQGYCCQKLNEDGDLSVIALVLRYTNADVTTGKYKVATDDQGNKVMPAIAWELQWIALSSYNMQQIKKLPDEDQDPYAIDIIMTHTNRAFGYEFSRATNQALWKRNSALVEEVKAAAERYKDGKQLVAKLGKKLDMTGWKALLSGATIGAEDAKLDNMLEL